MGAHLPRNVLQQLFILQPGSINASAEDAMSTGGVLKVFDFS